MQQLSNVHIETLQNPTLYSLDQIERACRIASLLCRGRLVLVEPPKKLAH
jgi:hypothetical protein